MNNRQHENQAGEGAERCPFCGGTGTLTPKRQKRPNVRAADMARLEEAGWAAKKPGNWENWGAHAAWALRAYIGADGQLRPAWQRMMDDLRDGADLPGLGYVPWPGDRPAGWIPWGMGYANVRREYKRIASADGPRARKEEKEDPEADFARLEEAGWAAMKPGRQEGLTERAAWALRAYAGGGGKVMPALRSMLRDLRRGVCVPGIGTWRDIWTAQRPGEPVPDGCPRGWLTARWLYGGVCRAYRRLENAQLSTLKQ